MKFRTLKTSTVEGKMRKWQDFYKGLVSKEEFTLGEIISLMKSKKEISFGLVKHWHSSTDDQCPSEPICVDRACEFIVSAILAGGEGILVKLYTEKGLWEYGIRSDNSITLQLSNWSEERFHIVFSGLPDEMFFEDEPNPEGRDVEAQIIIVDSGVHPIPKAP